LGRRSSTFPGPQEVLPRIGGQPNKGTQSFIAYSKVQFINRLWIKPLWKFPLKIGG
jgi:hypothetical protein